VNSVITDPLKDTLQARVDTRGNLAVATASQPVTAQANLTVDPQIGVAFGTGTVIDLWADPNTQVSAAISAHTTLTTQAVGSIEISGLLTDATAGVPVGATTS
jgi:hypothetical protein